MPEVPLPDAFEWVRYPWGPALRCRDLAAVAGHCFTTRAPVLGTGPLTPGDGWHRVALAMGISPRAIVRLRQVHGTRVVRVARHEAFPPEASDWSAGDIAASDHPGVAVCVKVADCVPILLADRRSGSVAAVHAGWRGTAAGAARVAVEALGEHFGAAPGDLLAAIGPSIGPCCYRVGQDVRAAFEAAGTQTGSLDAWFSRTPSPRHCTECREQTPQHRTADRPCSSTRGPPTPISCAARACRRRRSTSRASARPAIARPSTRIG